MSSYKLNYCGTHESESKSKRLDHAYEVILMGRTARFEQQTRAL